ncbi:MAG TPA: hypothetical protein VFV68_03770 [Agriterribacter sp.]|nr:hypothetical protein [Agriterribacter sp.]
MNGNLLKLYQRNDRIVLSLSIFQAALILTAAVLSLMHQDTYASESGTWQLQSIGQDLINSIFIVPVLLTCTVYTLRNNKTAFFIWGGIHLYLLYTFIIYAFNIHFNNFFLLYCVVLGISFYSLLWYAYRMVLIYMQSAIDYRYPQKLLAVYLIMIGSFFISLWLSEIIPAMFQHTHPQILEETGLFTNPVQVLDLSVVLPGFILTGVLLLRGKRAGYLLTPSLLAFMVLMNITIASLSIFMEYKQLEYSGALASNMGLLAIISALLLKRHLKSLTTPNEPE